METSAMKKLYFYLQYLFHSVYEKISNVDSATIFRYKASNHLNYAIGGNLLCIKIF